MTVLQVVEDGRLTYLASVKTGHRPWHKLLPVLDNCCLCGKLKKQRQRWCARCQVRWNNRNHKPDTRRRNVPYGKKRGTCTVCGKAVWLGKGSLDEPTCRDCRNRAFWHICDQCHNTFEPRQRDQRFCSQDCWYAELRLYDDRRHASKVSGRKRRAIHNATWDGISDEQIWERDQWVCGVPGCTLGPMSRTWARSDPLAPTIDHVIPLSRGGTDTADNKRAAHAVCNFRKGRKLDSELF